MVGFWSRAIALSDFKIFWFVELYCSSRTTMSPKHFSLSRQKIFEIMVGFWSRAIALSDFKIFWFVELYCSSRTTMSPKHFSLSCQTKSPNYGRILVEGDSIVGFQKFLVFLKQRLKPHKNVPRHFSLSRQKIFEIMVGIWSNAIALSDFKNFWFFEISCSSRTKMSPNTLVMIDILRGFKKFLVLESLKYCATVARQAVLDSTLRKINCWKVTNIILYVG